MTNPIPEAAVEAAARAVHDVECSCEYPDFHDEATLAHRRRLAEAALTASRPHMEAESKAEGWDECLQAIAWAEENGPADKAYEYVRANNPYRAATIAERTHDEPA